MRKTRKRTRGGATSRGLIGTLFKGTQRLPAHVSEEPEWYLDGAEVKLTRVFTIVLILHLVAVGGILAFKMIEKASVPSGVVTGVGNEIPEKAEAKKALFPAKVAMAAPAVKQPLKIERKKSVLVEDPSRKGVAVYRVSTGETLVSVARDLGVSVSELRRLNDLHTGDQLYAGKWLSVPDKKTATVGNGSVPKTEAKVASSPKVLKAVPIGSSSKAAPIKAKPVKAIVAKPVVSSGKKVASSQKKKTATYTVQSGDNLHKISRKTGVGYSTLITLNKLDKPELLQVGQVLKVPGK